MHAQAQVENHFILLQFKNKGKIISMDVEERKLNELKSVLHAPE